MVAGAISLLACLFLAFQSPIGVEVNRGIKPLQQLHYSRKIQPLDFYTHQQTHFYRKNTVRSPAITLALPIHLGATSPIA